VALALLVAALTLVSTASARGGEGWGRYPSFIGRYQVRVISGGKLHVVGGELTMFPQEEFPGSIQPAGILKLKTSKGNNDLVYLTELTHRGAEGRFATIKGGAFVGPKIGTFRGRLLAPGKLEATFSTGGLGTIKALFVRFSRSPTP
jgi:hypothetical protein